MKPSTTGRDTIPCPPPLASVPDVTAREHRDWRRACRARRITLACKGQSVARRRLEEGAGRRENESLVEFVERTLSRVQS